MFNNKYYKNIFNINMPNSLLQTLTDVEEYVNSINVKLSCKVATTANIILSGTQTIDDIAVKSNDRILVKDQSTGSQNGLYLCRTGDWIRSDDMGPEGTQNFRGYSFVFIEQGIILRLIRSFLFQAVEFILKLFPSYILATLFTLIAKTLKFRDLRVTMPISIENEALYLNIGLGVEDTSIFPFVVKNKGWEQFEAKEISNILNSEAQYIESKTSFGNR